MVVKKVAKWAWKKDEKEADWMGENLVEYLDARTVDHLVEKMAEWLVGKKAGKSVDCWVVWWASNLVDCSDELKVGH